jgi:hypothetical protein
VEGDVKVMSFGPWVIGYGSMRIIDGLLTLGIILVITGNITCNPGIMSATKKTITYSR